MSYLKGYHCKYIALCILSGLLFFGLKIAQASPPQPPSSESTVISNEVCRQCHTVSNAVLLNASAERDLCDYCHEVQEPPLALIADIEDRLGALGNQILTLHLSEQPRDSRFERAVEHYFTVNRMVETGVWSAENTAFMQVSLLKAEVLLRLLENDLHSGILTASPAVTHSLTVTFTPGQPLSKLTTAVLNPLTVLPVLAISVQYLIALALLCLALALVQLLRHRAPPALFDLGVLQFLEITGIAVVMTRNPCFFMSMFTRRIDYVA